MKVLMLPSLDSFRADESGIKRVVEAYHRYAPDFGIEFVNGGDYDISAVHAGATTEYADCALLHGLYWSADYDASDAEYRTNARIVQSIRTAKEITVPSKWVAKTIRREVRVNPHIVPHGIEWDEWQHDEPNEGYVLWNKNRTYDVCSPEALGILAEHFPGQHFLTTFAPKELPNIKATGLVPHDKMKTMVQQAGVYLSLVKETFGIGVLEAMAAGVPILGWDYGGNVDLVQHGVNGYLVKYGNYDDLAEGLDYCLKHRDTLGANGREMAKTWTWQNAMSKLVEVFKLANRPEETTTGVVIPVYNKPPAQIRRALESVINQSHKPDRVVVVDDGSTDAETIKVIDELAAEYTGHTEHKPEIEVVRQDNQGVAFARNNGIEILNTDFVACLDSDDWLEPEWLKACHNAMTKDKTLGMAYTGMTTHRPDGQQAVGRWPGMADADRQMEGINQVPTCCLFRRKVWERLGGYRQRYAPEGAGSEDAEFWLRQMAYGWRAEEVTTAPLFNYSWLSGQVSGNRNYREVNWIEKHPFTKDQKYPFMAVTTSQRHSHPVRQYDQPDISVIIPVGPGHEDYVIDALDSLEAQTYRNWEAIVVWDTVAPEMVDFIKTAYPYVKQTFTFYSDDQSGESKGAGYARNRGAEIASAPFLLWLDADDWLTNNCIEEMLRAWNQNQGVVYSDYIKILHNVSREEATNTRNVKKIIEYNETKQIAVAKFRAYDFDCNRAIVQPEPGSPAPYYWCLTTTLTPKAWHDEIGGYDETMESWEDADYAYRLVRAGHCYTYIKDALVVVRTHTGTRLNKGLQIHKDLVKYMTRKYAEMETSKMGCSSCGGNSRVSVAASTVTPSTDQRLISTIADTDMVLVMYNQDDMGKHNTGKHSVFGAAINPMTNEKFFYGRHGCGEKFLVHKNDAYVTGRHGELTPSNRFKPIDDEIREVVPPEIVAQTKAILEPKPLPSIEEAREKAKAEMESKFAKVAGPTIEKEPEFQPMTKSENFQKLPGVNFKTAIALREAGYFTTDDLTSAGVDGLVAVKGIGKKTAEKIIEALEK